MKIWKWKLYPLDHQAIEMPAGAKLLDVQVQGAEVCLWALCDPDAPLELREIVTYGTGHSLPDDPGEYVATFQLEDGVLVFHVFETPKRT